MNVETRMYVVDLLESYQKRSKQIELLHYELSHPARVSENEIIGALALAHGDGEGGAQEVMPPTKPFTSHSTTRRGLIT